MLQPDSTTTPQPCRPCLNADERPACVECYRSTGVSMAFCERHDAHPHGPLEAAIHDLGAVELASGRYAYDYCGEWFVISDPQALYQTPTGMYDVWLANHAVKMPDWWSPATPYATVFHDGSYPIAYPSAHQAHWAIACAYVRRYVITASPITGEVVSA